MYNNVQAGHYFNKHESTNLFIRMVVNKYRKTLQRLIVNLPISSALEVGSGEGYILYYIQEVRPDILLIGSDISEEMVCLARNRHREIIWCVAKAENLPFLDGSFDLVIACEVLEHVLDPNIVLKQLRRVSKKFCIISVPEEPLWRILNILRGKYLRNFGNTPGHVQHWSASSISRLVKEYFDNIEVVKSVPWVFVRAIKN
jgi:ubiquinone/menaquinone biosynthesis C-methylase UbiE